MGYIESVKLDKMVMIRMPLEWHRHLQNKARERGPGTQITSLIREAIYATYPMPRVRNKSGGGVNTVKMNTLRRMNKI